MRPLVTFKIRFLTRKCCHSALEKGHGHPYRPTRVSRSEIISMGRMLLKGKLFKWTSALLLIASCWMMNYSGAFVFQDCWNKWPQVGLRTESILRLEETLWVWNLHDSKACLLKGFTGAFTLACLSLVVPDHLRHVNVWLQPLPLPSRELSTTTPHRRPTVSFLRIPWTGYGTLLHNPEGSQDR